jgi:hypothetical protein
MISHIGQMLEDGIRATNHQSIQKHRWGNFLALSNAKRFKAKTIDSERYVGN